MSLEAGHFALDHRLGRPWAGAVGLEELFKLAQRVHRDRPRSR